MTASSHPFVTIRPRDRGLILLAFFGYLMMVGCLSYLYGVHTTVWIFLSLTLNIVLLAMPFLLRRKELGWTHPVVMHSFLVFVGSHAVRTPLYIRGLDYHLALPGWQGDELARLVAYELLLSALALGAYYLGFFSRLRPPVPRLYFRPPKAVVGKSLLAIAAAIAVFMLYVRSQGGVSNHLLSWVEIGRVDAIKGEGHWLKISRLGGLTALLWFAYDRRALRRPLFWVAALSCATINFLGSGSRSSVIFLLIVGTLIWLIGKRRFSPVRTLTVVLICLLIIASLGRLRRGLFRGEVDWSTLYSVGAVDSFLESVDELRFRYGSLDSAYPVLARVPHEVDFLYGRSYLTLIALPVPRAVWPDKPGTVGKLAGEVFYGVKAGIPPGAVGEAYWNLHIPGVLVLFGLFGAFHRAMVSFLQRYRGHPGAVVIYSLTIFWSQPSISAAAEWVYMMASVIALLWLAGALRFSPPRGRDAALHAAGSSAEAGPMDGNRFIA